MEKNELDYSMHRYYEQRASEYDNWYDRRGRYSDPKTNAAWHAQVAELSRQITRFGETLNKGPEARVLDLACGTGKWTPFLARPLHEQARLVAYDYSPAMLAETQARLEDEDPEVSSKVSFVRGDAYNLPFAESSFDCIFLGFWLSHVPRERVYPFFGEVKRVLKPGGKLLIFDSLLAPGKQADNVQQRPLNDGSQHQVLKIYYTPQELQAALGRIFATAAADSTRDFFIIGEASV